MRRLAVSVSGNRGFNRPHCSTQLAEQPFSVFLARPWGLESCLREFQNLRMLELEETSVLTLSCPNRCTDGETEAQGGEGLRITEHQPFLPASLVQATGLSPSPGLLACPPWRAQTLPGSPAHCWSNRDGLPNIGLKLASYLPLMLTYLSNPHGDMTNPNKTTGSQFALKGSGIDCREPSSGSLCPQGGREAQYPDRWDLDSVLLCCFRTVR